LSTFAWKPAQRAKKSLSAPPALIVSIVCRPMIVVAASWPRSICARRLASTRRPRRLAQRHHVQHGNAQTEAGQ
jgi:hypothetical protein